MSVHNETLAYRIVWERAESVAMCQAAVVTASLGPDEHVGLCAGYVGEGRFALEAFHARFRGEAVDHFVLGEQCQRSRRAFPFERWPQSARAAFLSARTLFRTLIRSDDDDFLVATPRAYAVIRWGQADEGLSEMNVVDPRVWLRVTAHMGLTGTASADDA